MFEQKVGKTYIREWKEDGNRANIVIIHGIGEHSGRYLHVGEYLSGHGFNVFTGDLTGHGLSDGTRVYVDTAEDYLQDVDFFLGRINNALPTYILGHSMGGFIVLYYGTRIFNPKVKGIIASSPYLKEKLRIPAWKQSLAKAVCKIAPRLELQSGITGEMCCRDKEICAKYNNDSLNHTGATARWFIEVGKARDYILAHPESFKYPCLILQAGGDLIIDKAANERFLNEMPVADKEYVEYENFYHEILNDPEKEKPLQKICSWIDNRL